MILKVIIDDQTYEINVPAVVLAEARDYFDQIDRDLDVGWQMGRDWVEAPDRIQRAQIVADRLLTALETDNRKLGTLLAGYLLDRLPGLESVEPDLQGEPQNTRFEMGRPPQAAPKTSSVTSKPSGKGLSKLEAMEQAGREVTQVFRVGRGYRFSVFDHETGTWMDAPLAPTEQEAERLRQASFRARYEALLVGR
ncbi:hypothetical protein [Thermochromatium tepidum]|uniref:Uncharacterized protein n=1 Tax=Thermochromatium tepidum ATCC 43061 TaxID=316276 RepID=A0A6I6EFD1_THETI|nr:hypothetical protein [Thermochromatium tepidum]QGU32900.1 hypothetical protein E6P07_07835 [Thermochromatium tepidum ATCC 43061]